MATKYFGNDVEFFGYIPDKDGKQVWVSPYDDKFKQFKTIKPDGVNFELEGAVRDNMRGMMIESQNEVLGLTINTGIKYSLLPVNECGDKVFEFPHEFGCMPDINSTGKDKGPDRDALKLLAEKVTRRPAGGHIQVSSQNLFVKNDYVWAYICALFKEFQKEEDEKIRNAIYARLQSFEEWKTFSERTTMIEVIMLLASMRASMVYGNKQGLTRKEVFALEKERRTLYGQAGACRIKFFVDKNGNLLQGVEIRSPSPAWLFIDTTNGAVDRLEAEILKAADGKFTKEDLEVARKLLEVTDGSPQFLLSEQFTAKSPMLSKLVTFLRGEVKIREFNFDFTDRDFGKDKPVIRGVNYLIASSQWRWNGSKPTHPISNYFK